MYKQAGEKDAGLLQQLSLRQEDMDGRVLQALQQALSAIVQAQQLLQQDVAYHRQLRTGGDGCRPADCTPFPGVEDKSGLPGVSPKTPPELQ
ncbi:MAG: hypothetical protein GX167_07110 [Firmicutes bacterium]|nr:hypothetical protein [Bacillota bacterium]